MFSSDSALAALVATRHAARFRALYPRAPAALSLGLEALARHALGLLARTDAPYHDAHHTVSVAETAALILDGRRALGETVEPEDWLHLVAAAFLHDLGYVRHLCRDDREGDVVAGPAGGRMRLAPGASDAALAPVHVDRVVVWLRERLPDHPFLDADRLARAIRHTRFPPCTAFRAPAARPDPDGEPGDLRAADLIGQLADPRYRRKLVALYREFVETGEAQRLGYASPDDVWHAFPGFYETRVTPHVGAARIRLNATPSGSAVLEALARNLARARIDARRAAARDAGVRTRRLGA
ncbi:MAG: HD domain-containing protein [Paracoccaceae bacterium]